MKILAIETSCDETAVAVLEAKPGAKNPRFKILSNIVSSQVKLHSPYGGVVPSLAMREHYRNITTCFEQALNKAYGLPSTNFTKKLVLGKKKKEFDVVAVTMGPGLEPALWVGINFAKSIALATNKPIIGINHLEGHLYANWLSSKPKNIVFPALGLIVSGGHTELVLMKNHGNYKLVGATRDDAAGEAFDKVAKLLGLGYPGGPIISRIAEEYKTSSKNFEFRNSKFSIELPRPMINSKDYDFSFSGLKTAVLYLVKDLAKKYSLERIAPPIAKEFQDSVIDVLIAKTLRAAKEYKVKTILMGGGVTANKKLRAKMTEIVEKELPNVPLFIPDLKFSVDNAAMIGVAAYFHAKKKKFTMPEKLRANGIMQL